MSASEIVLITGANQGLGFLAAQQLSKLPGYHVIIGARSAEKGNAAVNKLKADGAISVVSSLVVDMDSDQTLLSAATDIEKRFGKLDVLVNNAGVNLENDPSQKALSSRVVMEKTFSTNVFGVATLTDALFPLLAKSGFPRIVNVSSGLGSLAFMSNFNGPWAAYRPIAYNTSKSALNSMTVHYAYLLWQKQPNSRVVALNPGYNATEMNRGHDDGAQDPALGAAGIVCLITAPADSEFKTADFRDWTGKLEDW